MRFKRGWRQTWAGTDPEAPAICLCADCIRRAGKPRRLLKLRELHLLRRRIVNRGARSLPL